jgi:hypothetical protein
MRTLTRRYTVLTMANGLWRGAGRLAMVWGRVVLVAGATEQTGVSKYCRGKVG